MIAITGYKNDKHNIERGNIYFINLDPTIGSETKKTRPAIVVSNEVQNKTSSRIVIVPITSNIKNLYPFETGLYVKDRKAKAMADQIRSIDKSRLLGYLGSCTREELLNLEKAMKLVLALD